MKVLDFLKSNWIYIAGAVSLLVAIICIIVLINVIESSQRDYDLYKEYQHESDSLKNLYNDNKMLILNKQVIIDSLSYRSDSLTCLLDSLVGRVEYLTKSRMNLKQSNDKKLNEIIQRIASSDAVRDSLRNVYFKR